MDRRPLTMPAGASEDAVHISVVQAFDVWRCVIEAGQVQQALQYFNYIRHILGEADSTIE